MSVLCRVFNLSVPPRPRPPTSTSPNVRSLDVLHTLSRLTFMVDIVTFEVGTVFLVGNIEI